MKRLTTSDPLRTALRQERRLLLAFCLLFGALIVALVMNGRQAEHIRRLEAEHADDREVIADLAGRYNRARDEMSILEFNMNLYYKDKYEKDKAGP